MKELVKHESPEELAKRLGACLRRVDRQLLRLMATLNRLHDAIEAGAARQELIRLIERALDIADRIDPVETPEEVYS